ncbi:ABC transporter ATP-binding protein [Streptomyces roseirectus]|uniref:ABC transporter ATP-binding protein n=1 Tax=Streptomyces roseirectus TaxID=2768066 RepID=UPI001FE61602|nr:ABC transporter ATP-binding protein [Streptomyces roseirectus]
MTPLLRTEGVGRTHTLRGARIDLLDDVTLDLEAGQITALVGHSGSGKTTLLHIMGLLDDPDRGRVFLGDDDMTNLAEAARADARRRRLGFVFQSHNLLPQHSAYRNILVPYAGSRTDGEPRARRLLDRVGLTARASHLPGELSGGEQQRVALARALINDPPVVLADEPTGNLDPDSERQLLTLFRELADEGRAVVVVTHNAAISDTADVVHRLEKGLLTTERPARRHVDDHTTPPRRPDHTTPPRRPDHPASRNRQSPQQPGHPTRTETTPA